MATDPAWPQRLLAAGLAGAVVLAGLDLPLVEDALFWWVPKGLWMAEHGLAMSAAGDLPTAVAVPLVGHDLVPQWAAGLPDYDHPPLWYAWLALFMGASATAKAAHFACLVPAVLAAVGWVAVAERLGRPWAGLAPLCLPPVVAQLLRPELDLPLLAVVPWFLVAVLDRRWGAVVLLGLLAPWIKEPGVLLVVPAMLVALSSARLSARGLWPVLAALAPLLGLGAWRLVHGRLAEPERLPPDLTQYLHDLAVVGRIGLWEQGRWALLLALPLLGWRLHRRKTRLAPLVPVLGLAAVWLCFFAAVGFFATRGADEPMTHVRYFLPGLCALAVGLASALPALALPGLFFLTVRSPFGPEASLTGLQAALAERDAVPFIVAALEEGHTVWIGSYQAAALLQPWAGVTATPPPPRSASGGRLRIYAERTVPTEPAPGDIVLGAAYGEPTGALERALVLSTLERWSRGEATVTAWVVDAHRPASGQGP